MITPCRICQRGNKRACGIFPYCYATSDDFKGLPADVYQKAQITKTVYHYGKGICPQGASRDYEFAVYIPSSLGSDVSTIFAQWHGMPDRTLVQTPQGEVKKLTIDEFVELEKTTIFKKNEGHEKVAKLDKQGNPGERQTRKSCISVPERSTDGSWNKEAILHWRSGSPVDGSISKQIPTISG